MPNNILETKFHIPFARAGGVARPRLLEKLNAGVNGLQKLTLISAPAGYGKTTLVVEWLCPEHEGGQDSGCERASYKVAWLSLDETDNDPANFLRYWLSALQRVEESIGQNARSLLGMPQIPPPVEIVHELINEFTGLETQIVLVLDDYHAINNPEIHLAVEYFLDHQPEKMHLVVTTRVDPPWPLSRLRVRGQMTEIRARELCFTLDEARDFFSQSMNLDLSTETIKILEERTEGWAAGLQLAALALQNEPDQQFFLSEFCGSHRYIIDYLLDEVLKRQPAEIHAFLSRTAVLKRFNAELCQKVTGNNASAEILARLDRSNLFMVPLDNQRGWYRYHHLFSDVLRAGLDAETEREIYAQAAVWFEEHGLYSEAITYWLAVPKAGEAARLIRQVATDRLKNGELQTLLGWLRALPDEVVNQDPDLASHKALCLLMTGQTAQAREYASWIFETFSGKMQESGHARLLAMQAWFSVNAGDQRTADFARAALNELDPADSFFRTLALISLGTFYGWSANLTASNKVFRETIDLGRQMKHPFSELVALANLAFNLLELGQLHEAEALCRGALAQYVDSRGKHLPVLGIVYIPLASICFEKGDFDEAKDLAERSIELCRRLFSNYVMGGDSEITLARITYVREGLEKTIAYIESTSASVMKRGLTFVVFKLAIVRTETYLLDGRLAEAEMSLKELELIVQAGLSKLDKLLAHLRARFLLSSGQSDKALEILNRLEIADREEGCLRRLMGVHITQALAMHQQGKTDQAHRIFETALRLAAKEGYRAVLIPFKGRPTRALLEASRIVAPGFVDSILKDYPSVEKEPSPFAALPEPLSEQEIRVLKRIVAGKTNQEIADDLVISVGTAKWHVHNILQKLGVNNRPQAIARAREFGLT